MNVRTADSPSTVAIAAGAPNALRLIGKDFEAGGAVAFPKLYDLESSSCGDDDISRALGYGFTGVIGAPAHVQRAPSGHRFVRVDLTTEDIVLSGRAAALEFELPEERLGTERTLRPDVIVLRFDSCVNVLEFSQRGIEKSLLRIVDRIRRLLNGVAVALEGPGEVLERFSAPFDLLIYELHGQDLTSVTAEAQYAHLLAPQKPVLFKLVSALQHQPLLQINWHLRQLCFEGAAGLVLQGRSCRDDDRLVLEDLPFPKGFPWPMISVVVPCRDEESYIDECIRELLATDYPRVEVIVVDNGSTDGTFEEAKQHPVKVVRSEPGLCRARNTGLQEARGDIVVYIDADAFPARRWLWFVAIRLMTSSNVAVGGALIAPRSLTPRRRLLGSVPGNPEAVRKGLNECAHAAGCNLAVYREVLNEIAGFDEAFGAGDDVDLCWRLMEQGWTIGFHASALVWHYPRRTLWAFLRQQFSYGRGEVRLERKWPTKFREDGEIQWPTGVYSNTRKDGFENMRENERIGARDRRARKLMFPLEESVLRKLALDGNGVAVAAILLILAALGRRPAVSASMVVVAVGIGLLVVFAAARIAAAELRRRGEHLEWQWHALMIPAIVCQPLARRLGRLREKMAICRRCVRWLGQLNTSGETPEGQTQSATESEFLDRLRASCGQLLSVRPRMDGEDWEFAATVLGYATLRYSRMPVTDCRDGRMPRKQPRVLVYRKTTTRGIARLWAAGAVATLLFGLLGESTLAVSFGMASAAVASAVVIDLVLTRRVSVIGFEYASR